MANDAQTIQERIKQLGGTELLSVKKEITDAHKHIYDNEIIRAVASGMIDTKTWLLMITDTRIILLYQGMLGEAQKEEISISHVKGVSVKSGMLTADLSIDTGNQVKKITNVGKTLANKVQDTVSRLLNGQEIPEDIKKAQDTTKQTTSDTQSTNQANDTTSSKKNKKILSIFGICFLVICAIGFIFGDEEKPLTPEEQVAIYQSEVNDIDDDISEVEIMETADGRKRLSIFYTKDIVYNTMYTIGQDTMKIAEELVEEKLIDDQTDVFFFVHMPTVDKLGNEGTGLAMKIEWNGATLNKIKWNNMFAPQFLNLAQYVEIRPLIRQDVIKLYQDAESRNQYSYFLQKALAQ